MKLGPEWQKNSPSAQAAGGKREVEKKVSDKGLSKRELSENLQSCNCPGTYSLLGEN